MPAKVSPLCGRFALRSLLAKVGSSTMAAGLLILGTTSELRSDEPPEAVRVLSELQSQFNDARQGMELQRALQSRMNAHREATRALGERVEAANAASRQLERECDGNAACRIHRSGLGVLVENLNFMGIPVGKMVSVPLDYTRRRVQQNQEMASAKEGYEKAMTARIALDRELDELGINSLSQLEASLGRSSGERAKCDAVVGKIYNYCDTSAALNELRVKCGRLPDLDYLQSDEQRAYARNVCDKLGTLCRARCD